MAQVKTGAEGHVETVGVAKTLSWKPRGDWSPLQFLALCSFAVLQAELTNQDEGGGGGLEGFLQGCPSKSVR